MRRPLLIRWLGRTRYDAALSMQQQIVAGIRAGESRETLLLLEHEPVITLGRGSNPSHIRRSPGELQRDGVEVHEVGRGGDVTWHGPGQLVGYPLLALPKERRDAHAYLRDLEQALIDSVADYGVTAGRAAGLTGVWVGNAKLAAIGVRLSTGWITSHGFALNVAEDLSGFDAIVPCGISDREVTSLGRLLGETPVLEQVAATTARHVARVFGMTPDSAEKPGERLALELAKQAGVGS